ncbi:MAG: apolipoprotein N-acyltransferase [bacterium]
MGGRKLALGGVWRWLAAAASGLLLAFSFPPFDSGQIAWVALIPLLLAVLHAPDEGRNAVRFSFKIGMTAGLVFWLVAMSWLFRLFETSSAPAFLILIGWLLLSAYCALYMGVFAMSVAWVARAIGTKKLWQTMVLTFLIPVLWVGGEMFRSILFTGFPWNLLAISQYRNVVLIQCAQWVGAPGISAVVMLANTGLAFTIWRYIPPNAQKTYKPHLELFVALMGVAFCVRTGVIMIRQNAPLSGEVTIAAIQPAIQQVTKWTDEQVNTIHATFRDLTHLALMDASGKPDLIIWPETATPYCVMDETGSSKDLVEEMSRGGSPLLVGSMDEVNLGAETVCYNGSFLFGTNGVMSRHYYKQRLVPFGECIPLSGMFPWLAKLAPMGWNCSAGSEATVFTMEGTPDWAFSCLICFEDSMADLSRAAVKRGARLLVNQTNDAWFDRSAGPEQHLSQCVFRCVENRVSAVRVANSGISCLIEPTGRIVEQTENGPGKLPEPRVLRLQVTIPGEGFELTLYTKYGDWLFGIPCGVVAAVCFVLAFVAARRKKLPNRMEKTDHE